MWNLISLKEQSTIKMVETFYKTNEPITINSLSELTNTSNRSVKNYLNELKETMHEVGGEFISSSEGVNFKIPINIGLDYFQKQLFRQSLGFKLLEKLFFEGSRTNEQLINELYVSQSTLNRLVKIIREALTPYGLKLETAPYRITGKEQLIRNFYTTYFVEAYTANEWPFEMLDKNTIDKILPPVSDYYQSTSELMSYQTFRFHFAVGLIRRLQGYSTKNIFLEDECLTVNYNRLTTEIEEKLAYLTFESSNEKESYISGLAITQLLLSKPVLSDRLQQDDDLKNRFNKIKQMVDFLTEHFELPEENQTNLLAEIDNTLSFFANNNEVVQPKTYILYPPRDYHLVDLYRRKYSTFLDTVQQGMLSLAENRGFEPTEETLEYLIYTLISKWNDLTKHLFSRYNTTIIKVYSHMNFRHGQNIAESLISDLPSAVEVSVFKEAIMNEEIASKYDFDILISTETLTLDIEQPIIYMYKSRSGFQYDKLHKLIRDTANKNEQKAREDFLKKHAFLLRKEETSIE